MSIDLTAAFVFTAFLLGTYVGTTDTQRTIAHRCLNGERVRIASIQIKCPDSPGRREKR